MSNRVVKELTTVVIVPALLLMLSLVAAQAQPEQWTPTGDMTTPRSDCAATLLQDGRVLVAGGWGNSNAPLASSEIYDPATGTWTPTGSLQTARAKHQLVTLADGRVLAIGGRDSDQNIAAIVEIYAPATGVWLGTTSPQRARGPYFTATLLANGQVLAVGGEGSGPSVELYDPATETWFVGPPLKTDRGGHTATRLRDGRVLVAAGTDLATFDTLATAELYDPTSYSWLNTGQDLNAGRYFHSATLLANGKVLVAGGDGPRSVGGQIRDSGVYSGELYDPATDTWTTTGGVHFHSYSTPTLLADNRVLRLGSKNVPAEIYASSRGEWTSTASFPGGLGCTVIALSDGRVLAMGGEPPNSFSSASAKAWLFDYEQIVYPQLALGGGFEPVLMLSNQGGKPWSGRAILDSGAWPTDRVWALDGNNRTGSSDFPIELDPHSTQTFTLTGSASAVSGWLGIKGGAGTSFISSSFFYNYQVGSELQDSTGVAPAQLQRKVSFPVERTKNVNTGIAVRLAENPLTLTLYDEDGNTLQTTTLRLDGARFFDQIFGGVPVEFVGSVRVESPTPFCLVVLRQERIPGAALRFQLTAVQATELP